MQIALDANIWILGILEINPFCTKILFDLSRFYIVIPNQIRAEVERNLTDKHLKQFYRFVLPSGIKIDYETVPSNYIKSFEEKGLKKGDAEIGAFCEWRQIEIFVSNNIEKRNYLTQLADGVHTNVIVTEIEISRAYELRNIGFKSFDAMHIACSESADIDIFLTTDDKLLKRAEREKDNINIKIANPLSWLMEMI